ncbi:LPS assembly protein LptD, partial [Klebsiella pneumoniae]|uniref:LPS assembly protein LptD n=1 Tax=Klebsiella pneumoniae TaxID=573 RepID=UPI0039C20735
GSLTLVPDGNSAPRGRTLSPAKVRFAANGTPCTFKSSQDRAVPVASIDSGLYFDRDTNWFGKDYRQTLEPRAFYLYCEKTN